MFPSMATSGLVAIRLRDDSNSWCAAAEDSGGMQCNRNHIAGYEKFTVSEDGGKFSFMGHMDKYARDDQTANKVLFDRTAIGDDEKFTLEQQSDGSYYFKGGAGSKWCRKVGDTMGCNNGDSDPHNWVTKGA